MNKLSFLISAALISSSITVASLPSYAAIPLSIDGKMLPSLAPMLEQSTPAVVLISVKGTHKVKQQVPESFKFFFGDPRQKPSQGQQFRGLGSGVIINAKEGYLVTNNHVIAEADEILITLKDGRQLTAKKIGADEASDIALLQIEAEDLKAMKFADSDNLRVGDFAVAIGSPFGLGQTVTSGIVSALGRSGLNIENYEDFIQTDAAINSGNSGGALVNLRGELIGINTAIVGPNGGNVGIGFAIPSNMVENLVTQIIEFGEVRRGELGVSGRSVNSEIADAMELNTIQGGFIEQVIPNSAASEAGIKAGDVITQVNGKRIRSFSELRGKIGSIGAGKTVKLTIVRGNDKPIIYSVKLKRADNSNIIAANIHPMLQGSELENNNQGEGVMVSSVAPNSPALLIGLKPDDLIVGINRRAIKNLAELRKALKEQKGVFALNIVRGNRNLYLMVR
jgi:serine protease Do/serine protease DegQ